MNGGELTPEGIRTALDATWKPRFPVLPYGWKRIPLGKPPSPLACEAELFAPDDSLRLATKAWLIATDTPVHPLHAAWLNAPVQGPAPLACAREPHPDSPWHWDGRGTWWR